MVKIVSIMVRENTFATACFLIFAIGVGVSVEGGALRMATAADVYDYIIRCFTTTTREHESVVLLHPDIRHSKELHKAERIARKAEAAQRLAKMGKWV